VLELLQKMRLLTRQITSGAGFDLAMNLPYKRAKSPNESSSATAGGRLSQK
jgi:hypothetical protein